MKCRSSCSMGLLGLIGIFSFFVGCRSTPDAEPPDYSVSLTDWSDRLEVFMEYKMPTPGEEISFGVHLTDLRDFKPVTEGTLVLTFVSRGSGQKSETTADHPLREGIYSLRHAFAEPGEYDFSVSLQSQKITDKMDLGTLEVREMLSLPEPNDKRSVNEVPFLKEQQWKMEFKVEPVQTQTITQTISAPGKIVPTIYRMAKISPPLDGKIAGEQSIALPRHGDSVKSGDILVIIEPSLASFSNSDEYQIDLEVRNSETKLKLARAELERVRALYEKEAVPQKRLLEAEAGLDIAEANHSQALDKKSAFQNIKLQPGPDSKSPYYYVRSPIDGRIVDLTYALGEQVKAGDVVATVLDDSRIWLDIAVFENDIAKVKHSAGGYFTLMDKAMTYTFDRYDGKLVFFGSVIDETTRALSVIYELSNPAGEFLIGSFITAHLHTAANIQTLSIPKSAVFDSGGNRVCFVQVGGESFEKRVISLGIEGPDYFQVVSGLHAGERIVSKGGYAVKLAAESASKDVGEGHYH